MAKPKRAKPRRKQQPKPKPKVPFGKRARSALFVTLIIVGSLLVIGAVAAGIDQLLRWMGFDPGLGPGGAGSSRYGGGRSVRMSLSAGSIFVVLALPIGFLVWLLKGGNSGK